MKVAEVNAGGAIFGGDQLAIIAGPCVVESLEINLRHAERLAKISREKRRIYRLQILFRQGQSH